MKKLIVRLLLLLPLLLLVMAVNTWIDPVHLLSDDYYRQAGVILEKHAVEYGDCDDRKLMVEFLKHKSSTEMLVLGSSRTAVIDSSNTGSALLNLSLTSATTEDLVAAYGVYVSSHPAPRKVLIGTDPFCFNKARSRKTMNGFLLAPYYNSMMNRMQLPPLPETPENPFTSSKYLNVISFKYFQNSLLAISKRGFKRITPAIYYDNKKVSIKDPNGVLSYRSGWQATAADVDLSVERDTANDLVTGINGYTEISPERVELLRRFITYLQAQNVEVTLFLAPYHPTMWKYIAAQQKYAIVMQTEKTLLQMAAKNKMAVTGSYNPAGYDLISVDYYDAVHLKPGGLKKVFEKDHK